MLKFLLISFLVIFLIFQFFGFFLKLATRMLGNKIQKEMEKEQERRQGYTTQEQGDIKIMISQDRNQRKRKEFTGGEYVDFEEVERAEG